MADLHVFFLFYYYYFFQSYLARVSFYLLFSVESDCHHQLVFIEFFFFFAILTSCNVARTGVHSDNDKFIPKNNTEQENTFDWLYICGLSNQNK